MSNVPKLRFLGFEGKWQEKRLGEVVYLDLKPIEKPTDTYIRLRVRSHGKGTFYEKIDNPENIEMETLYEVKEDQLLVNITFAWEHAICVTSKKDSGKIVSHRFPTYSFTEGNVPAFYKYFILLPRFKYHLGAASPGGAGRNRVLNKTAFLELLVPVPASAEQNKIANFLTLIDKKITKQDEKVSVLEQYKKGLMQKIFSHEIRFKDDNGEDYPEWEKKCIAEIALSIDYGMNTAAIPYDGTNQYLRITDIDEATRVYITDKRVSPNGNLDDYYLLEEGDILFARTGASTGKSFYYNSKYGKMYFAGYLIRIRLSSCVSSKYLYYNTLTEDFRSWVKIMSMRSGQPGINAKEFGLYQAYVPIKSEQIKIANFLSLYDCKIEKEKAKLEALREQKKGLLQQMFV